ncbi:DUF6313 family protein [Micromonospora saelicesensis]|uniref:Uncharacterized protein n=1 Tax=Micromonospora saelicesensis TaxID=285676 RepID=A0A1C5ABK0_9ACTN|nr:DUF6313 family protein [Micromonospora saelicesensis]SCF42622.1 hypothetical protein GA0070561_6623 [Micromonospora saelicesensis]
MPPSPAVNARVPLLPPPPDRVRDRLRRWVRAWGAYTGLRHWLLVRGTILSAIFAALYLTSGVVIGWRTTYDVAIGITSPGDPSVSVPALAWPVSLAGWLAAPAVFGAVAGVVISFAIAGRRQRPIGEVLAKAGDS